MTVYTEKTIPSALGDEFYALFAFLVLPLGGASAYTEPPVPAVTYNECLVPTTVSTECSVPATSYTEKQLV